MKIESVQRYAPFIHVPGASVLVPASPFVVTIYPTQVHVKNLMTLQTSLIYFSFAHPVMEMTTQLDLEHGSVIVWGKTEESYFRYHLYGHSDSLLFWSQKGDLKPSMTGADVQICQLKPVTIQRSLERLSLGVHRKQDWQLMCRRKDPEELVPFLYALGQWVGSQLAPQTSAALGTLSMINLLLPPDFEAGFQKFFQAAFSLLNGLVCPSLEDDHLWGFQLPRPDSSVHLLTLPEALFRHLRSLLFCEPQEDFIQILPKLPKAFHCGRLMGVQSNIGIFDLEWSKKTIRRVVIHANKDIEIALNFSHLKTMRCNRKQRMSVDSRLCLKSGVVYTLDNFEK